MKKILRKNQMVKIITIDVEGDWEDVTTSRPMPFKQARRLLIETKRRYAKHLHNSSLFTYGDIYEYCVASCQYDRYEMRIASTKNR